MYLEADDWDAGYRQILLDARPDEAGGRHHRSVLLLCNADVDAMASARILTYLLRCDAIQYQLMPCTSYSDLKETLISMKDNFDADDICTVVLLNFGASRNLTKLYAVNPDAQEAILPGTVKTFVMDCRRPVHLANIHEGENVVVFVNESKQLIDEFPSDGDDLSGNEEESDSDSSDSDSDNDEDDDGSRNSGVSDEEKDDSDDDEDEHQANFDDVEGSAAEKKKGTPDDDSDDQYDGEDEKEEEEDDKEDDTAPQPSSKRQKTDEQPEVREDEDVASDASEDSPSPSQEEEAGDAKDKDHANSPLSQRNRHKDRAQRLIRYYDQGSYFAAPISYVAYHMAEQLRHGEEGDLLWLACVGVTDAYLHSRVDKNGFGEIGHALKNSCVKMFPDTRVDRALNSFNAEHLDGRETDALNYDQSLTKIKFSDNGRILAVNDYRFFLLRHTSLLDSMLYSEYVYSKLQMNTKKGQQRFMEMLAKMGLPLDECRQPFRFMKTSLRSRLKSEFENYADVRGAKELVFSSHAKQPYLTCSFPLFFLCSIVPIWQEYNLDLSGLTFTSFNRVTGYSSLLSASDMSYAVTALLEYEALDPNRDVPASDRGGTAKLSSKAVSVEAFNNAYEALGTHSEPMSGLLNGLNSEGYDASNLVNGGNLSSNIGLGAGLRRAMALQKTIITTGSGLMERGSIALLRHFRYAHVTSSTVGGDLNRADLIQSSRNNAGNEKRDHIFSKPLALTRLAHFLMDINRENGKWAGAKSRPLILIADKPSTGTCLVVGYEYPDRAGELKDNRFGKHFERTAEGIAGLSFKFDCFENNVIELNAGDVQRFMESLHVLLEGVSRGD
ncbi:MAG: hypothetical protein SGILL_000399 [Bacillariaceae sp.]